MSSMKIELEKFHFCSNGTRFTNWNYGEKDHNFALLLGKFEIRIKSFRIKASAKKVSKENFIRP